MILLILVPAALLVLALCFVPREPDELPPISRRTLDRLDESTVVK